MDVSVTIMFTIYSCKAPYGHNLLGDAKYMEMGAWTDHQKPISNIV